MCALVLHALFDFVTRSIGYTQALASDIKRRIAPLLKLFGKKEDAFLDQDTLFCQNNRRNKNALCPFKVLMENISLDETIEFKMLSK